MLPRRAEWLPNLPQLSGEALVPRIEASLTAIVREELATRRGRVAGGLHRAGQRAGAFRRATRRCRRNCRDVAQLA